MKSAAGSLAYPGYMNTLDTDFLIICPLEVDGERTQNPNQAFREKTKSRQVFLKQKRLSCERCVSLVFKSLTVMQVCLT